MKILIINGPNLNFLKKRELYYSKKSFKKIKKEINFYSNLFNLFFFNSNCEGKIVNFIHKNLDADFLIINPAAYSHYSLSILDCIKIFKGFIIEIHITNLYKRENFRKKSLISLNSNIIISGMGIEAYIHSIDYIYKLCL